MTERLKKPGWFPEPSGESDKIAFSLDKLKAVFEVSALHDNAWFVHDRNTAWLRFAVVQFYQSDCDETNILVQPVFYGEGPSGTLRECRHTYWGEDGYIFYPTAKTITKGLEKLSEFFDLD